LSKHQIIILSSFVSATDIFGVFIS